MPKESVFASSTARSDRIPPSSEEAERGVLGSILLDAARVMDLCLESQITAESFYTPAHAVIFDAMFALSQQNGAIDILTVSERLRATGQIDKIGGAATLDRMIDATPTTAHAEFYIDIVRQKHLLRSIIDCAREAERDCFESDENADILLDRAEQAFLDITERQHGFMIPWGQAVMKTMSSIERFYESQGAGGLRGMSTGFANMDHVLQGLRQGEMIVLAARPSMGKTALAMNIAENVALGRSGDHTPRPVGVFSLEMSSEALVMRMICSLAEVSSFKLTSGYVSATAVHGKLTQAASVLSKAPLFVDDTGGLDILELRARARRMKKKHDIQLIVVDYLQLIHSRDYGSQGRQIEIANVSGSLKAMAKELNVPVLVLSQLSRAPEQRDKTGKPKLSDLRDSGAIEQDADVVCMLRRPCKYPDDEDYEDDTLAIVEVAKQRNGPTGLVRLNFEEDFTRFRDRAHGTDGVDEADRPGTAAYGEKR